MAVPLRLTAAQQKANLLLAGPQRHTLLVGGSRSGKTFLYVRAVIVRALKTMGSRHAMLRLRDNAAWKSLALDTFPTVMRRCWPAVPYSMHKSEKYFTLGTGSEIWIGGLQDKEAVDRILGLEFATILFNECSQIPYGSVLVALTRLAQVVPGLRQRAYYDLNPVGKAHWTNRLFGERRDPTSMQPLSDPENYRRQFMNPEDNAENLAPEYLASLRALPARQRKRFYTGEYVEESEGALWTFETIERCRAPHPGKENIRRTVVAVDASGASGREDLTADEIGIVVMSLGADGHGYVLADRSIREKPAVWGKVVANAWEDFEADCVVAEKNFGGEMVRFVIKQADERIKVIMVNASRGKVVRAEPVSGLYGDEVTSPRIHHVADKPGDRFMLLEEQLCSFTTSGYIGEESPDRADALVWAATELMLQGQRIPMSSPVIVTSPLNIVGENFGRGP